MQINRLPFLIVAFIVVGLMFGVPSWLFANAPIPLPQITATSTPAMPPASPDSWIIVDLPPDATQLEYGTEVYRLVCKACHGDKGQGLTDDWRAQWAPQDQNCWQSKCHALNHPPDGFYMPISPAVVGPPLQIFDTALDLYNYIHNNMPWHDRGSMTEKESWSVTAYILKINDIDPGPELNAETAAGILLRAKPTQIASSSSVAAETAQDSLDNAPDETDGGIPLFWTVALFAVAALVIIGAFLLVRRKAG